MSRRDIYYWKCDRPAAFHGTGPRPRADEVPEEEVRTALVAHFGDSERLPVPRHLSDSVAEPATVPTRAIVLSPASGQGNHLTWNAEIDGIPAFLRIENGPEGDDHLEMESAVLGEVAKAGVPVPHVLGCDASRSKVSFAWQALERIPHPDLNQWWKAGTLDETAVAFEIGKGVALWQAVQTKGFGPFDLESWRQGGGLRGLHDSYAAYFRLRLDEHLSFLERSGFFTAERRAEIEGMINEHAGLLEISQGVLVHKDLALWNVLGEPGRVAAFIDFDDAVAGDVLDDLSLLACFHDASFLEQAFAGYESVRALPDDWRPRFWLHLLRNLIVKSVIRVGAGYFERDAGFFLIGAGASGADLRRFTEDRLATAMRGLREDSGLELL